MPTHVKQSLGGVNIPCAMGSGGIMIPCLAADSPTKHFESFNWVSFAEVCNNHQIDNPAMLPDMVICVCVVACDSMLKIPRPGVTSLH
jgi:hypothetical protein